MNDVLANFRQQWQRELQISPKHKGAASSKKKAEDWTDGKNDDVESRVSILSYLIFILLLFLLHSNLNNF